MDLISTICNYDKEFNYYQDFDNVIAQSRKFEDKEVLDRDTCYQSILKHYLAYMPVFSDLTYLWFDELGYSTKAEININIDPKDCEQQYILRFNENLLDMLTGFKQDKMKINTMYKLFEQYSGMVQNSVAYKNAMVRIIPRYYETIKLLLLKSGCYEDELVDRNLEENIKARHKIAIKYINRDYIQEMILLLLLKPLFNATEKKFYCKDAVLNKSMLCDILSILYDETIDELETSIRLVKLFVPELSLDKIKEIFCIREQQGDEQGVLSGGLIYKNEFIYLTIGMIIMYLEYLQYPSLVNEELDKKMQYIMQSTVRNLCSGIIKCRDAKENGISKDVRVGIEHCISYALNYMPPAVRKEQAKECESSIASFVKEMYAGTDLDADTNISVETVLSEATSTVSELPNRVGYLKKEFCSGEFNGYFGDKYIYDIKEVSTKRGNVILYLIQKGDFLGLLIDDYSFTHTVHLSCISVFMQQLCNHNNQQEQNTEQDTQPDIQSDMQQDIQSVETDKSENEYKVNDKDISEYSNHRDKVVFDCLYKMRSEYFKMISDDSKVQANCLAIEIETMCLTPENLTVIAGMINIPQSYVNDVLSTPIETVDSLGINYGRPYKATKDVLAVSTGIGSKYKYHGFGNKELELVEMKSGTYRSYYANIPADKYLVLSNLLAIRPQRRKYINKKSLTAQQMYCKAYAFNFSLKINETFVLTKKSGMMETNIPKFDFVWLCVEVDVNNDWSQEINDNYADIFYSFGQGISTEDTELDDIVEKQVEEDTREDTQIKGIVIEEVRELDKEEIEVEGEGVEDIEEVEKVEDIEEVEDIKEAEHTIEDLFLDEIEEEVSVDDDYIDFTDNATEDEEKEDKSQEVLQISSNLIVSPTGKRYTRESLKTTYEIKTNTSKGVANVIPNIMLTDDYFRRLVLKDTPKQPVSSKLKPYDPLKDFFEFIGGDL